MTDIQEAVGVVMAYGIQSDISTAAAAGGTSQRLRRVSSSLNGQKDVFASNEVRQDQQVSDSRHGGRSVAGGFQGELSTVTYNDLIAALMRNTWSAGAALTQSDFTSLTVSGGVITFGSGNPSTLGLRIGQYVDFTGLSVSANNTRARITALSSTTITTYPALADNTTDTSCAITVVGKTIIMGTAKTALTFEQYGSTIDVTQVFKHCRIGGASISLPPNGIATVSWDIMGRDFDNLDAANAPYFTSVTAAPNTNLLTGIDGGVRLNGVEQGIVTQLDMSLSLNLNSSPVIGTPLKPDIFYGRSVLTGQVSYYLQDKNLLNVFKNETEVDLVVQALAPDGSFLAFNMQRLKLNGAQAQINTDGGVIVQSPFQALLKSAGTGYDATTLSIQRSDT